MAEIAIISDARRGWGQFGCHDSYNKVPDIRLSVLELYRYQPKQYPITCVLYNYLVVSTESYHRSNSHLNS
jgi:hypothetical protein